MSKRARVKMCVCVCACVSACRCIAAIIKPRHRVPQRDATKVKCVNACVRVRACTCYLLVGCIPSHAYRGAYSCAHLFQEIGVLFVPSIIKPRHRVAQRNTTEVKRSERAANQCITQHGHMAREVLHADGQECAVRNPTGIMSLEKKKEEISQNFPNAKMTWKFVLRT